MVNTVNIGIAEMNVVRAPDKIRTAGLGSCVGVVIYDVKSQVAGMVHVMLPEAEINRPGLALNKAKYGDTAINELLKLLEKNGVRTSNLKAKIAGGAQMFQFSSASSSSTGMLRIGPRNVEIVKSELKKYRIPLISEDVGGNKGRTVEFDVQTGMLSIRTVNQGILEI